jgi:hypothetical protein
VSCRGGDSRQVLKEKLEALCGNLQLLSGAKMAERVDRRRMHGCAAARIEIEHEVDSGLMAPKTLVDDGGWLCGTNLGAAAIARNLRKLLSLEQAVWTRGP